MESKNEKDWSKAPIIVLIGVIAALIPIIIFITGKQNLPEIMAKPTPNPLPISFLQGDWTGNVTNQSAGTISESFLVTIKFGDCDLGKVCGILRIEKTDSDLCTGNILFNSIDGDRLLFLTQNRSPSCGSARTEYLELLDKNTLLYVSSGDNGETRGELHRVQ